MSKPILALVLLTLPLLTAAGERCDDSLSVAYRKCMATAMDQQMAEACLKEEWGRQDRRFNAAYAKVFFNMTPRQQQALRKAQRQWVRWRDAKCLVFAVDSGSGGRVDLRECRARTEAFRACELERMR